MKSHATRCWVALAAFAAGLTSTAGQTLPTGVTLEPFYSFSQVDFEKDKVKTVGMWEVPGRPQHFYVLDQTGFIYSLFPDTTKTYAAGQLKDYSKKLLANFQIKTHQRLEAEYGAYSIAFHPKFAQNSFFYLIYLGYRPGQLAARDTGHRSGGILNVERWVAEPGYNQIRLDATVFTMPRDSAYGTASMNFGPDGFLYISTSDYKRDGWDSTTLARKLLRIDVDNKDPGKEYAVPKDNPYYNHANAAVKKEIWASGFRNAWSFAFNFQTSALWLADVGHEGTVGREEINIVQPGRNYGWADGGNSEPSLTGYGIQGNCPSGFTAKGKTCANLQNPDYVFTWGTANAQQMRCIVMGPAFRGDPTSPFYGYHFVTDVHTNRFWAVKAGVQPQLVGQSPASITPNDNGHDGIVNLSEDSYGNLYATAVSWYRGERFHNIYRLAHPQLKPRAAPTSLRQAYAPRNRSGRLWTRAGGGVIELPAGFAGAELYNMRGERVWSHRGRPGTGLVVVAVPADVETGLLQVRYLR